MNFSKTTFLLTLLALTCPQQTIAMEVEPTPNPFSLLPEEMLQEIFLHSSHTLKSISTTSQQMNSALHNSESSNLFWKSLYEKEFGGSKNADLSWKNAYIESVAFLKLNKSLNDQGNFACRKGHLQLLMRLVNIDGLNPTVDASNLYIASQEGHLDVARFLVSRGSDIESCANENATPLYIASKNGRRDIVEYLISKKANVNYVCANGSSPLFGAVVGKQIDIMKFLTENGANLETGSSRYSPLTYAAMNGYADAAKLMIQRGADVNAPDNLGNTALYLASASGSSVIVDMLLVSGATEPRGREYSSTYIASQNGHNEVTRLLIAKYPHTINIPSANGATPLYVSAQNNHVECARLLLMAGALPNVIYDAGYTPLYVAAQKGHLEMVKLLVNSGANINQQTNRGFTAARAASGNNHNDIENYLINYPLPLADTAG